MELPQGSKVAATRPPEADPAAHGPVSGRRGGRLHLPRDHQERVARDSFAELMNKHRLQRAIVRRRYPSRMAFQRPA